jgi:hypothetical protein
MNRLIEQFRGVSLKTASYDSETYQWNFIFSGGWLLQVAAPWRMVVNDVIKLGWEDDGQLFGLPKPLIAEDRFDKHLIRRSVEFVSFNELGDLVVDFSAFGRIEVFNGSCGYEGWVITGPEGQCIVAQGGGNVVDLKEG